MIVVVRGKNDLETLFPEIAKEWHPTKNGTLRPCDVTAKSGKRIWWLKHHRDDKTKKEFDFEWEAVIASRVNGNDCPYLSGQKVYKGFNDLETLYPEIAREWHPTRNGSLKPCDIVIYSHKKVWWLKHHIDDKTGKEYDFEWEAIVNSRVYSKGCPYISGKAVYKGFNDLETLYPELAKEWHPTRNGSLKPYEVTAYSSKKVWWLLHYKDVKTGKEYDFEWEATIASRVNGNGCPYLSIPAKAVYKGFNDLETLYPEIAREWHPTRNGGLKPYDVTVHSGKKVWWLLHYKDDKTEKEYDFEWESIIAHRVDGSGCPYLSGSKAERFLYSYFKDNNIAFRAEKKFTNELWVKFYSYDFYLHKEKLIVEVDGIQHFKWVTFFTSTEKEFKDRVKTDNLKNKYCLQYRIPILRIPYIYSVTDDKDKIESLVSEFIKTRKVPQEILDFYKAYKGSIGSNYYDIAVELNKI